MFPTVTVSAYHDQLNAEFSKAYDICEIHGINSIKYVKITLHFHASKHDAEQNEPSLVVLHVIQMNFWVAFGQ